MVDNSGLTDNATTITKDQIAIILHEISAFSDGIYATKSYSDFERIKNEINDFLMQMFAKMLD